MGTNDDTKLFDEHDAHPMEGPDVETAEEEEHEPWQPPQSEKIAEPTPVVIAKPQESITLTGVIPPAAPVQSPSFERPLSEASARKYAPLCAPVAYEASKLASMTPWLQIPLDLQLHFVESARLILSGKTPTNSNQSFVNSVWDEATRLLSM